MWIVDAANVVGSRPDGWWRDRPGAAKRLLAQVEAAIRTGTLTPPVVVVLEGGARAAADPFEDLGSPGRPAVVHARGSGDDEIVDVVRHLADARAGEESRTDASGVVVVTADRDLVRRVRELGARTIGPSTFLDALPDPPSTPLS